VPNQREEAKFIAKQFFEAWWRGDLDILSSLSRIPFLLYEKPIIYSREELFRKYREFWSQHGSEISKDLDSGHGVEAHLISEWYKSQGREMPTALLRELELEEHDYIVLVYSASEPRGGIFVKRADEGLRVAAALGR
jgi:hypothetical protein